MSDRIQLVEAERAIAILDDSIEKLSFLDSITPDVLQHRDELSKFIGDEISKTMAEQRRLEKRYEELVEERAFMKGMVNKSKYKEVQEEIQNVSRALRESTNNLVKSLKENPNVSGNMIKVQRDRTDLSDLMLRCVQEIRERGFFKTLIHKVDEETATRIRFQHLKTREKELREAVLRLQESLADEQRTFTRTTSEQKLAITQLKDELQILKSSTSVDTKFKTKESKAAVTAIWREFKHKEKYLEIRQKDLEDKIQTETLVNGQTKEFLQKKHLSLLDSIAKWESKYEKDVQELDTDIRDINNKRTVLLEQLGILQDRRKKEQEVELRNREQKEGEIQLLSAQKELFKRQNKASRTIQRELRAFVKRKKEMEALLGGKKGGKKEKGGKKKK